MFDKSVRILFVVLTIAVFGIGASSSLSAAPGKATGSAQNDKIKKLQNEQSQVKKNVKQIDSKLSENQKSVQHKLSQIEQLNEDIRQRNALIDSQNVEITYLGDRISQMNDEILGMEMDYNVAKRKYVELIYHAYQKNSVYDRLLFLFSANSIQQSYNRFQYIREFAKMRRRQAADIKDTRAELVQKRKELEGTKNRSETLLASREKEKNNIENEKKQQKELVASLRKEEKELRSQLKAQQQAADKLNKKIQDLIAAEAAKAAKSNQKPSSSKNTASQKSSTPAKGGQQSANKGQSQPAQKPQPVETKDPMTLSFEKQKGRMHWPVMRGRITGHYGLQKHPVLPNEMVNNKGVYITSPAGIEALAVAEGKVTQIFSIPGNNNAVIVRHGTYLTVYANLTSIFVSVGQSVVQGDKLGRLYTDPDNKTSSQLFFQVWNEKNIQNPESWLRPLK